MKGIEIKMNDTIDKLLVKNAGKGVSKGINKEQKHARWGTHRTRLEKQNYVRISLKLKFEKKSLTILRRRKQLSGQFSTCFGSFSIGDGQCVPLDQMGLLYL